MFVRVLVFIISFVVGVLILKYNEPLVRTFGKSSFAERYLGSGGSYTMWKIIAIVAMMIGFLYLIGTIELGRWDNLNLDKTVTNQQIIE